MSNIFFWIGTEAEFIKVFPVIIECQSMGNVCHIIATGQNDIKKSRILSFVQLNGKYVELSQEKDIKKSTLGLLSWFARTKKRAKGELKRFFENENLAGECLVVHGDTVSTYMGALVGKSLGMVVCHVEAGLRSHHLFNPFPEEIDRILTSRRARIHFAPGETAVHNLSKAKGRIVNTEYNTLLDSLKYSQRMEVVTLGIDEILCQEYFVFVMHRQENIANTAFFKSVISKIEEIAKEKKCVFLLHKITENALRDIEELDNLKKNANFILLPRTDYFDFMKLLNRASFVITDGGSNQEELHYMGKPCLIMRKTTERNEGIGQNAILFSGKVEDILRFSNEYKNYEILPVDADVNPSKVIAECLGA